LAEHDLENQDVRTPDAPAPKRHSHLLGAALAAMLLLALGGFGYWKYVYYPSTPQYALTQFFEAVNARDYETVYDLVEVKGTPLEVFVPTAQSLRTLAERASNLIPRVQEYRFGKAQQEGDRARVETTAVVLDTPQGTPPSASTFNVQMVRVNGLWKIEGRWMMAEIQRRGADAILKGLAF